MAPAAIVRTGTAGGVQPENCSRFRSNSRRLACSDGSIRTSAAPHWVEPAVVTPIAFVLTLLFFAIADRKR